MKYFVIECENLYDDVDRVPLCLTDDVSSYGRGYEIYEIAEDGSLTCIKECDEALESGMALYWWDEDDNPENSVPNIIQQFKGLCRDKVTAIFIKSLQNKSGFEEPIEDILQDIRCVGSHGEAIDDHWVVFGEYFDSYFNVGY